MITFLQYARATALLSAAGAGFLLGAQSATPQYATIQTTNLNQRELGEAVGMADLPTMDVLVHIIPPALMAEKCADAGQPPTGRFWFACTDFTKKPCQVWLPASTIVFSPLLGRVQWGDSEMDQAVPHELLHCVHPNWHAPFTDALKKDVP